MEGRYWVWERSDGYIGYSKRATAPTSIGRYTFKVLYDSAEWDDLIVTFIEDARNLSRKHQRLVESWD